MVRGTAVLVGLTLIGSGIYLHRIGVAGGSSRNSKGSTSNAIVSAGHPEPAAPALRVTSVVQLGRILEIKGSTEPGAVVMINGQPAATIFDNSSFRQFVGPMPPGTNIITITSQNEQGGVNTQQFAYTIQ